MTRVWRVSLPLTCGLLQLVLLLEMLVVPQVKLAGFWELTALASEQEDERDDEDDEDDEEDDANKLRIAMALLELLDLDIPNC